VHASSSRASVAPEHPLLPFQFVAEHAAGDLHQPLPLLADVREILDALRTRA